MNRLWTARVGIARAPTTTYDARVGFYHFAVSNNFCIRNGTVGQRCDLPDGPYATRWGYGICTQSFARSYVPERVPYGLVWDPWVQLASIWMPYIGPERSIPETLPKLPNRDSYSMGISKSRSGGGLYGPVRCMFRRRTGLSGFLGFIWLEYVCSLFKPYLASDLIRLLKELLDRIRTKHRAGPVVWCDWGISTLSTSVYPWLVSRTSTDGARRP